MATTTINGDLKATTVEIGGGGDIIDKFQKEALTISTFALGGHTTSFQTITVTGVIQSDFIIPAKPVNMDNEIVVIGQSTTSNEVVLKFNNTSDSAATSTATSINVLIVSFA